MPSITQLEYVLAIYRTGHFGRAAEECGATQPTLSAQIQKVEAELGITIFDRSKKPIEVTPKARKLIEYAQEVISAHQRLLWFSQTDARLLEGDFALGIIPTLAPYVVPWFVGKFSQNAPRLSLSLHEHPTDQLVDELHNQRLDAAIVATPLLEGGIREQPLFYDPFYLYMHESEEISSNTEVEASDLCESKIWLLEDGHCVRTQVINFCGVGRSGCPIGNISFAVGSFETLRHLIDATGGYTLFPETYVRTLAPQVAINQVRPFASVTPTREISLVYLRSCWKTDILSVLKDCIINSLPRSLRIVAKDGEILPVRSA